MGIHLFEERRTIIADTAPTTSYNEIWTLVVWDPNAKKYVPDNGPQATLRMMGHGEVPFAPPIYRGRLPSPEAIRFCANQQREHEEWANRRANMLSGDE